MRTYTIFLTFTAFLLVLVGCTDAGLKVDDVRFAVLMNESLVEVDPEFQAGQTIYIVLLDVSGFERDNDSMIHADIDLHVYTSDGVEIYTQENMLGDLGYMLAIDSRLETPYVSLETLGLESGTYDVDIMVKDRLADTSIREKTGFEII